MKIKLLKKVREKHVVRQKNNKYRYTCYSRFFEIETNWTTNLKGIMEKRSKEILYHARLLVGNKRKTEKLN
jgi:hypothetical protein